MRWAVISVPKSGEQARVNQERVKKDSDFCVVLLLIKAEVVSSKEHLGKRWAFYYPKPSKVENDINQEERLQVRNEPSCKS